MIYLDNNATTPMAPEVIEAMRPWVTGEKYGNPSAGYRAGREARKAVDAARESVASLLGSTDPSEVIFTSGGTEAINSAIHSAIQLGGRHLVTTAAEHSAVEKPCEMLEKTGFSVTRLSVDSNGLIDLTELKEAIQAETALVSVILANNETGVITPIESVSEICREKSVMLHVDAVQAVGKIPVTSNICQMMSLSGHKFHGPKGVGALVVNRNARFRSLIQGGGQEDDRRSGTENVAGIVGLGAAAELAAEHLTERTRKLSSLRGRFEKGVIARLTDVQINGTQESRLPNTTNLYFPGVDGEGLLILLDQAGVACSPGSACGSGSVQPSRVIKAMGYSTERARSSVRFSVSEMNTAQEIDKAIEAVETAVGKLRVVMPSGGRVVVNS